jgi:hypothetical protein
MVEIRPAALDQPVDGVLRVQLVLPLCGNKMYYGYSRASDRTGPRRALIFIQ